MNRSSSSTSRSLLFVTTRATIVLPSDLLKRTTSRGRISSNIFLHLFSCSGSSAEVSPQEMLLEADAIWKRKYLLMEKFWLSCFEAKGIFPRPQSCTGNSPSGGGALPGLGCPDYSNALVGKRSRCQCVSGEICSFVAFTHIGAHSSILSHLADQRWPEGQHSLRPATHKYPARIAGCKDWCAGQFFRQG